MLKHAIVEGSKNLIRSFWLSVTAVFIITVSLTSVALVASLWVVAGFTLRQFDNQAVIYVYIKDGVTKDTRDRMQQDLRNFSPIKESTFIDKNQAKVELANNPIVSGSISTLQGVADSSGNALNFLRESFKVVPTTSENYNTVISFVEREEYSGIVDEIQGTQDYINSLQRIYYWTAIIGIVLVAVFGSISILVMINVLRIAIYSRRDEIEIMRLVGATNNYIRGPFIAEGIFYNLLASLLVLAIFIPAFVGLAPQIKVYLGVDINANSGGLMSLLYLALLATNGTGIIIGGLTSLIGTQRYLRF